MGALQKKPEHRFFLAVAIWYLVLSLAGFVPSVVFLSLEGQLPLPFVVHGIVYGTWILLFLLQASLVSAARVDIHRKTGIAGLVLLVLMIPAGFWPVLHKVAAGTKTVDGGGFNLVTILLAVAFGFYALAMRHKPDVHKRMMLLATMVLTVAAADRVSFLVQLADVRIFRKLLAIAPGLALLVFDGIVLRRFYVPVVVSLALTWLVIWFLVSDLFFMQPAGQELMHWLAGLYAGPDSSPAQ